MACHEPEESCFCKAFGIDCAEPAADARRCYLDGGGELYWKALTEKGEALTKAVESLLVEADGADAEKLEAEKDAIRTIVEKLPYSNLSLEGWERRCTDRKVQFSGMGRTVQTMSGMWNLYFRMPDLPVLRYQRL